MCALCLAFAAILGTTGLNSPADPSAIAASEVQIDVTWRDTSSNETGFEVRRSSTGPGGIFATIGTTGANAAMYSDAGLNASTRYCYQVRSYRKTGGKTTYSQPSVAACATTLDLVTPAAPSNARAVPGSESRIDVTWQDDSSNETGFEVHRSLDGAAGSFVLLASTGADSSGTTDFGLNPSTEYCYKARAVRNVSGTMLRSEFSNIACATTPAPPPPPPNAPSGTNVTPLGSDGVGVSWVDTSGNVEWFRVEHAPTSTGPWEFIGTWLSAAYTSWATYGLPSEQQICYRVIAVNAQGASAPSNVDCTTPPATPNPLTALWAAGPVVDLTWTDNSSVEDGYQVRRRAPGETWIDIAELPPDTTAYRDATVSGDGTYSYVVRARKDGGFSYPSWEASPTDGTPRPPDAPGLDAPAGYYGGTIWLAWYSNPVNVESFRIERCANEVCADADFAVIATVPVDASYTHSYQDLVADWTIYTYRVRAMNQVGASPPSNEAQGRTCIDGVDWESPCFPPLP